MAKHSGALMSSRLIAPKVGSSAATTSQKRSGSAASTSMSNTSMPANFLNRTALPSITGLPASAPILPRPSTAVPLEITADQVAARGVVVRARVGVGDDRLAGGGDAGRIGQRQVALGRHALGRLDRQFPGPRKAVVVQRRLAEIVVHPRRMIGQAMAWQRIVPTVPVWLPWPTPPRSAPCRCAAPEQRFAEAAALYRQALSLDDASAGRLVRPGPLPAVRPLLWRRGGGAAARA